MHTYYRSPVTGIIYRIDAKGNVTLTHNMWAEGYSDWERAALMGPHDLIYGRDDWRISIEDVPEHLR